MKILVANKTDKVDDRQVTEEEGCSMARKLDMMFVETSALRDEGINEAFEAVIDMVLDSHLSEVGSSLEVR